MPVALVLIGVLIIGGVVAFTQINTDVAADADTEPIARIENSDTGEMVVVENDEGEGETGVDTTDTAMSPADEPAVPASDASDSVYVDGSYEAQVEYKIPSGIMEPMEVSLTLENDIVTAASVAFDGVVGTSRLYQKKFTEAYQTEVVGQSIDDLELSRVGGASLSTGGFNDAVAMIQSEAAR